MTHWKNPWGSALAALVGKDWGPGEDPRTEEQIQSSKRMTYEILKDMTGQDFGYDRDAWETWIEAHPETFILSLDEQAERERAREARGIEFGPSSEKLAFRLKGP